MASEIKSKVDQNLGSIINNLGNSRISPSAYDTAWVARIKFGNKPLFPWSLGWIIQNQKKDGSWGGDPVYYHDRVISTLSSILALNEYREVSSEVPILINRGEAYLESNIDKLSQDIFETIGFELLFPSMMEDAWSKGLCVGVGYKELSYYQKLKERKISKLPSNIWSKELSVLHSIEFLGDNFPDQTPEVLENNNSIGCSPSATAYYYLKTGDSRALKYIDSFSKLGFAATAYPINFEDTWVLYLLNMIKKKKFNHLRGYNDAFGRVESNWSSDGLAWSYNFSKTDLDLSSVAYRVFMLAGKKKNFNALEAFKKGDIYECYPYELNSSVSANIHLLHAVVTDGSTNNFAKAEGIVDYLISQISDNGLIFDKWHTSPFYPSSRLLIVFCENDFLKMSHSETIINLADKIASLQRPNGSWGWVQETLEETAYSVMSLKFVRDSFGVDVYNKSIAFGEEYMLKAERKSNLPELWIGKAVYCPENVVRATIETALSL